MSVSAPVCAGKPDASQGETCLPSIPDPIAATLDAVDFDAAEAAATERKSRALDESFRLFGVIASLATSGREAAYRADEYELPLRGRQIYGAFKELVVHLERHHGVRREVMGIPLVRGAAK